MTPPLRKMEPDPIQAEASGQMRRIVVVLDTDPGVRWALEKGLRRSGYDVRTAANAGEAIRFVSEEPVAAVVMELLDEAGLTQEVLSQILDNPSPPKVICVSIDSDPQMVIDCIRRGAADFLPKPFSLGEIRAVLERALASDLEWKLMRRPDPTGSKPAASGSLLVGISLPMQELRTTIQQVAKTDLNCLIRGESGSGKDLVAREIHRLSTRRDKPFIKVNCSALPEHLLESELFGYEKGAFTGASFSKPGRFELANNGVIFLDEVADIQPNLQAKLLQVIEHKEFTKLGGKRHVRVDVQIIAATNANLEQRTQNGMFRQDLYFRLNEVCIWVPSLVSRKEDIPLLTRHFIQKHGRFANESPFAITSEELAALTAYSWPGNVRELESTIKRWLALGQRVLPGEPPETLAAVEPAEMKQQGSSLTDDSAVVATAVSDSRRSPKSSATTASATPDASRGEDRQSDDGDDRELILETLERVKWNRRKAAEALGMNYQKLRRRIEKLKLDQI